MLTRQLNYTRDKQRRSCTAQVRCMEIMLRAGAAMTQEQLTLLLHALPALDSPRVSSLSSIPCLRPHAGAAQGHVSSTCVQPMIGM